MNLKNLSAAAAIALLLSGTAQAALFDRGGGMIYDSTLNITWLKDWNQAKTSGYDADGKMTWDAAKTWADNLVYGGYSDWRLPFIVGIDAYVCSFGNNNEGGTDCGYNPRTASGGTVFSELAHMYYVTLGNKAYCTPGDSVCSTPQAGWGLANTGPFANIQYGNYWSGREYAPSPNTALSFTAPNGYQGRFDKVNELFAVAVRPGDVAAVPEPHTVALMLLGLGALTVAARRRPR